MKKILVTTSAALFAAVAMATFSAPANAGSFNFNIGVGGWGPGWGYGPGWGGIYVGGGPYYNSNAYALHVDWCFDHKGPTYNPNNNTYINGNGKMKYCNSPYI